MKIEYHEPTLNIKDDIRGEIKFEIKLIDDQVILKSDRFPTYHLAVVVDDHDMEITHVIRGEEWISSTAKHVLLYQYFDWNPPNFLHTPLLRNPDGSKLSKRHSHAAVSWYKEQGFLPEAILNYLANLVYNHPKGEIFSLEEFVSSFTDRTKIHSVGARFDITKLEWMNGEYIRKNQSASWRTKIKNQILDFYGRKLPEDIVEKTIPLIRERIKKLSDYLPLCQFFYERPQEYETDLTDKKKILADTAIQLKKLPDWKAERIGETMQLIQKTSGMKPGDYFMAMRVAVTGKKISPPLNESMEILGKDEVLARLKNIRI
jgi:glutamyl-tRNA synthetase